MHGLGNDFIVFDFTQVSSYTVTPAIVRMMASRHTGVGCDQVVAINASIDHDANISFYNADGSAPSMCVNGLRCAARYLMDTYHKDTLHLRVAGRYSCFAYRQDDEKICTELPLPTFAGAEIPIRKNIDGREISGTLAGFKSPICLSLGNPHAVFFMDDPHIDNFETNARPLESHPFFPERANITFARVVDEETIDIITYERGVGPTEACGSAACASHIAAYEKGLVHNKAKVIMPGGAATVEYVPDKKLALEATTSYIFKGEFIN